jgi:hypothetical protein
MRPPVLLIPLLALSLLSALTPTRAFAQCASSYSNVGYDGAGNVHAWTVITDNYTVAGSSCPPAYWVSNGGFTHTYSATVSIKSPSGRTSGNSGGGSRSSGTGIATIRADAYLPVAGEVGDFTTSETDTITCSVAGLFFVANNGPPFHPPPPTITGIVDNTTGANTVYVGQSNYLQVWGTALTAWGETPSPSVHGDTDSAISIAYFSTASDNQVNASYTVGTNARTGQHTLSLTTEAGNASGTYYVYDPTPAITSISPTNWQAGTSFPVTITGTGFGSSPSIAISDPSVSLATTGVSGTQ